MYLERKYKEMVCLAILDVTSGAHLLRTNRLSLMGLNRNIIIQNLATGLTFEDDADVVVSCRGTLNEPVWPNVPGIDEFQGEMMHSAAWNSR